MVKADSVEVAIAFERAAEARADAVRQMVLTVPALAGRGFAGCQLALETASSTLLLAIHLDGDCGEEPVDRLRFWCARARGWAAVPSAASALVRNTWRGRLLACSTKARCATVAELERALGELLGPAPRKVRAQEHPTLEIDARGPGSAGMAYNPGHRLLFIPGHLAPPVGDEFSLSLRTSGALAPVRCWGRVMRVRRAAAGGGAPAGFVLQLGIVAPPLAAALVSSCASMNADAMVEEARREAPRYPVRLDVELIRGGPVHAVSRPAIDPSRVPSAGAAVSLSVGGAFIETAHREPAGASLVLRFRLGERERFIIPATVVYETSAGIGVKFDRGARDEPALCRLLARIAARPRRVLVVDDDGLMRQMLSDSFAGLGYEVLAASSGEDAVRVLASELYALDAIVTDLRMDRVDGSQLVQAVSSARDHIEIALVVVSGGVDEEVLARLTRAGADAVFDKALRPDRITAAVDALVDEALARGRRAPAQDARLPRRRVDSA